MNWISVVATVLTMRYIKDSKDRAYSRTSSTAFISLLLTVASTALSKKMKKLVEG